jgi:hypothetical protein
MDAELDYIADSDVITVCSAQPTSYAEATTLYDGTAGKYRLATHALTGADFTKAAGDGATGRKVTVAEQASITVDASASATHVAICKSTGSVLKYVTTCASQALTSGNLVTIPAFDIQINDPT